VQRYFHGPEASFARFFSFLLEHLIARLVGHHSGHSLFFGKWLCYVAMFISNLLASFDTDSRKKKPSKKKHKQNKQTTPSPRKSRKQIASRYFFSAAKTLVCLVKGYINKPVTDVPTTGTRVVLYLRFLDFPCSLSSEEFLSLICFVFSPAISVVSEILSGLLEFSE
jgi:hypothetical protein